MNPNELSVMGDSASTKGGGGDDNNKRRQKQLDLAAPESNALFSMN